jgi:hypothetical protein
MADDISPSRSRSKKVDHTKVIKGVLPGLNTLIIDVPPNYDTYHGNRVYWNPGAGWGPPPFDNMGTNQYVFNWPKTDQAFIADSFDTFFNRNQVDNLLNIIESKDIVPRLQSINTTLSERAIVDSYYEPTKSNRYYSKVKDWKAAATRRFMRKGYSAKLAKVSANNAVGSFLYYSFAVAPLLSDFRKLRKAVVSIKDDLRKARLMEGKPETLHFQMKASSISKPSTELWDPSSTSRGVRYLSNEGTEYGVKKITIKGVRRPSFDSGALGGLNELLTRFGSSGPASFVWERIPLSFVVDWFVDLRSITNKLDNLLTGNTKQVTDACMSTKTETETNCIHFVHNTAQNPGLNGITVAWLNERQYHRVPLATPLGVTSSGRFGKKQQALAGALAYQVVAKLLAKVSK